MSKKRKARDYYYPVRVGRQVYYVDPADTPFLRRKKKRYVFEGNFVIPDPHPEWARRIKATYGEDS